MEQYLYVIIIVTSIFLCPFCFLSWEISVLPKLKTFLKKKNDNTNELNETFLDN